MSSLVEPTRSIELAGRPGELAADLGWTARLHEWSTTVDHKKIGIMYVVMAIVFLVIGGSMWIIAHLNHAMMPMDQVMQQMR